MHFKPENLFEESLVKAASDPSHRPQFYKDLSSAELFIIQHGVKPSESQQNLTIQEGMTIQIQNMEHNGKLYIPVFSSLTRLQQMISEEVAYLGVSALELMEFTKGADLLLNPGADFGKEFTKSEIASILDKSIWDPVKTHVQEKPAEVMLGQPQDYPYDLTNALTRFFRTKKQIKKAWLAHFHNPDDGLPPHTLIAIDAGNDYDKISGEMGIVLQSIEVPNPPVDVIAISGKGGIEDYFLNNQKPFYTRKFLGLF